MSDQSNSDSEWLDRREKVNRNATPSLPFDVMAQQKPRPISDAGNDVVFDSKPFTAGTTSIEISVSKKQRKYLLIQNNSANDMFIGFNKAATLSTAIKVPAGGNFELYYIVPTVPITVISSGAGSNGVILEGYITEARKV